MSQISISQWHNFSDDEIEGNGSSECFEARQQATAVALLWDTGILNQCTFCAGVVLILLNCRIPVDGKVAHELIWLWYHWPSVSPDTFPMHYLPHYFWFTATISAREQIPGTRSPSFWFFKVRFNDSGHHWLFDYLHNSCICLKLIHFPF